MDQKLWVSMGLLLLNVVGFAVMLGGIIVLQSTCKGTNQPKEFGDGGLLDPDLDCSDFHQYQWFKVLWQGFLLLINTAALVTGLLPVFNNVLAILRAISTVLLMDAANDYLSVLRTNTGATRQDSAVFFADWGGSAGLIISIISNLLFIIMLSANWDLLAKLLRGNDSSRQSSRSKRRPDEEAPEPKKDEVRPGKHGTRSTRQPNRGKQQQADEQAPADPAAQAQAQGVLNV